VASKRVATLADVVNKIGKKKSNNKGSGGEKRTNQTRGLIGSRAGAVQCGLIQKVRSP